MRTAWLGRCLCLASASVLVAACGDDKTSSSNPGQQEISSLSQADLKLRLGLEMYQAGRFQEAIGLFEQTLALEPTNHEAQFNRASALAQLQRSAEALAEFDRMLADPAHASDPAIFANRAITLNQLNRSEEALVDIDKALATNDKQGAWHLVRADTLIHMARYEEALKSAEHAKEVQPDLAQADLVRAECLSGLGRAGEADALYDELARKFPNDLALKKKIAELRGK